MEAAGLLKREPHPTDARLVRLRLTERGRELQTIMVKEMEALRERALAGLNAADRTEFVRLLKTLRANLDEPGKIAV
jgi:DNA-binding MarR family transcriptional regulator